MFAMIFRALPDVDIAWKDVWLGAFITAILFLLGQVLISIYISLTNVGSSFGAASSLVAILVWIYFSAQIVFLGAEITQVYANMYGSHVGTREWALKFPFRRREAAGKDKGAGAASEERPVRKSPWFGGRKVEGLRD
jgi:membrane protein